VRVLLLFDVQTSGTLINTGHDIRLILDDPSLHYVNISAGPLSYQYRVSELILHFGVTDSTGSEHTINGLSFPAEVSNCFPHVTVIASLSVTGNTQVSDRRSVKPNNARFPPFRCRSSVPVSPFPLAVCRCRIHCCRCHCRCVRYLYAAFCRLRL